MPLEESQGMRALARLPRAWRSAPCRPGRSSERDPRHFRGSMMNQLAPSRRGLWCAAVALLGLAGASAANAQGQAAVISGRVMTPQGQPLQGANVFITEMNISVGTNAAGRYTITVPGS